MTETDNNDYAIRKMLECMTAEIYEGRPKPEVPVEPDATIKSKATVAFPEVEEKKIPDLIPSIAEEIPRDSLPWGWIAATGSLIFALIACLLITRKP